MPVEIAAAIDAWITAQPDPKPSRPEAIRFALRDWLIGQGCLSPVLGSDPIKVPTDAEEISRLQDKVAGLRREGPPTPEKGMARLKRGVAKLRLKGLKDKAKN